VLSGGFDGAIGQSSTRAALIYQHAAQVQIERSQKPSVDALPASAIGHARKKHQDQSMKPRPIVRICPSGPRTRRGTAV
jgi:hypothetical protein